MWELDWIRHWVAGASHSILSEPPPPQSTWCTITTDGFGTPGRHNYYGTDDERGIMNLDRIQDTGLGLIESRDYDYRPGILVYYMIALYCICLQRIVDRKIRVDT